MDYDKIIEDALEGVSLKKVEVKVDPKVTDQFGDAPSYTGYILAEEPDFIEILRATDMQIQQVPSTAVCVSDVEETTANQSFQLYVCALLLDKGRTLDDPILQIIANAETTGEIESGLKQDGMSDEDIIKLYRDFINEN